MEASRDQNNVPTLLATRGSTGQIVPVRANATSHGLYVMFGSTGTDNGPDDAPRDQNYVPALMATSSEDGETPVAVYATQGGILLVDND